MLQVTRQKLNSLAEFHSIEFFWTINNNTIGNESMIVHFILVSADIQG